MGSQQTNTSVTANGLNINVYGGSGATGIQSNASNGNIDLGQGSDIQVTSYDNNFAYGIDLGNGSGNFKMDGGNIITTAEQGQATGIYSHGDASIDLGVGTTITTTSNSFSSGIQIGNDGQFNADSLTLHVTNTQSGTEKGLLLEEGSHADLGSQSVVNLDGRADLAEGIKIQNGATLTANNLNVTISSTSTNSSTARGIVLNGSGASADIGSGSTVTVSGSKFGQGIYLMDGSGTFTADNLTVEATGGGSLYGIQMDDGFMDLGENSTVSATGTGATIWLTGGEFTASELTVKTQQTTGINAQGGGSNVVVNIDGGSVVDGRNVGASGHTNGISATTFNFNGTAVDRNEIYAVNGYGASAQFSGQTINIANTDITMSGDGKSRGLWAIGDDDDLTSGGIINGDNLTIDMTDAGDNSVGVEVEQGGMINLTGDTTITTGGGVAIRNTQMIDPQGTLEPGGTIIGSGKMNIEGDIVNDSWGSIDLTMDAGSDFTGTTSVNDDITDLDPDAYSIINLTLANKALWTVTDDSSLTNLTSDGKVELASDMENGTYSTLDADAITLQDNSELDVDYAAATQASLDGTPLITGGDVTLDGDLKISDSTVSDLSDITSDQQLAQG